MIKPRKLKPGDRVAAILQRLSGILFGRPGGGVPIGDFPKYDDATLNVVAEEEGLSSLPVVTRMDFGHTDPMLVLPYGVTAQIDCDHQHLEILESAWWTRTACGSTALTARRLV